MQINILPIQDLPLSVSNELQQKISNFTIGLCRLTDIGDDQDIELLGSGTLIKINEIHAILTADHVLEVLPKSGRLGLILSRQPRHFSVDVKGLNYLRIARGKIDSEGPDLAAVILSAPIASAIAARKSFYNLIRYRDKAINDPPARIYGIWSNVGFVAENTRVEFGILNYKKVKAFNMFVGLGGPNQEPIEREDYDYLSMPVFYKSNLNIPSSFGGMSGGGLWQIQLIKENIDIKVGYILLSGVTFYQEALIDNSRNIICHGRSSVYKKAYDAICNS